MQVEKLKTIDADTLLSTPMRKTLFVVDGLIPQGLSVLSGSSKIGKSWLKPLSPEMREACRWLDCHTAQVQLICDNHLTDIPSVESFIKNADSEIKLISDYRKMLYRDIDSCHDPDEKTKLVVKRDDCTKALAQLRKDKKTAARIIEDNPKIKENILIEENMRSRYLGLNKSRKRGYER